MRQLESLAAALRVSRDLRPMLSHVIKPYVADKWFFRLTPQKCADALGAETRR